MKKLLGLLVAGLIFVSSAMAYDNPFLNIRDEAVKGERSKEFPNVSALCKQDNQRRMCKVFDSSSGEIAISEASPSGEIGILVYDGKSNTYTLCIVNNGQIVEERQVTKTEAEAMLRTFVGMYNKMVNIKIEKEVSI